MLISNDMLLRMKNRYSKRGQKLRADHWGISKAFKAFFESDNEPYADHIMWACVCVGIESF